MNRIKLASLVAALALASAPAVAVEADSDAGAKIVAPLQIKNVAPLYFGTIAPSLTVADVVAVSAAGVLNCGVELTCFTSDQTAAAFDVTGAVDAAYTIDLPTDIKIENGQGDTMRVTKFEGSKAIGTLSNGQDRFTVGGILEVGANQATGDYKGTFTVAVEYQ